MREVKYLVVHCAATKADQDISAADIESWHRKKGWLDIGYHYVIKRDGTQEVGRPESRPGAHARGFNHMSIGICLVGGVGKDGKTAENNFTDEQFTELATLLVDLRNRYPEAEILGHRDLPNVSKACPSFDVKEWWDSRN